jgi:flagellar biogenesis protein FliO
LLQAILSLFVVLALMLALIAFMRKYGRRIPALAGGNLGQVMGRLYLERGVSIHFVRVRSKVLVIGVTTNAISPLAVLPASEFDGQLVDLETDAPGEEPAALNPDAFLEHLRTAANPAETHEHPISDEEVSRLRGDIQRLQQFLQEEARGRND